jgi:hypothetical protein
MLGAFNDHIVAEDGLKHDELLPTQLRTGRRRGADGTVVFE